MVIPRGHVPGASPSVPTLHSLSPGLVNNGTAVFPVLGMLGHTQIVVVKSVRRLSRGSRPA
jgi:hypothetical protein